MENAAVSGKKIAAGKAIEYIKDGMTVGLGTGSTAYWAIQGIGGMVKNGLSIRAIATSVQSENLARELNIDAEGIEIGPSPAEADHIAAFGLPIEEMDLTVRSYNCLKREGIHTVGELVSRTEADLLDIRNFGQKSIDEVKIKLAGMGLSLKDSPAGFDPAAAALAYSDNDWNDDTDDSGYGAISPVGAPETADDTDYAETEQI